MFQITHTYQNIQTFTYGTNVFVCVKAAKRKLFIENLLQVTTSYFDGFALIYLFIICNAAATVIVAVVVNIVVVTA